MAARGVPGEGAKSYVQTTREAVSSLGRDYLVVSNFLNY